MDPATAIGLVAGVLQFGDVVHKLVREARIIYRSVDGTPEAASRLETIAKSIKAACVELVEEDEPQELQDLRVQCNKTADLLLVRIEKLKPKDGAHKSKRDVVRRAFRAVGSQKEIETMAKDLDRLAFCIDQHNLLMIRKQQNITTRSLNKLMKTFDKNQHTNVQELKRLRDSFLTNITRLPESSDTTQKSSQTVDLLMEIIAAIRKEATKVDQQHILLRSLWVDSVPQRYEHIPRAYKTTFRWIYGEQFPKQFTSSESENDRKTNTFPAWVKSDSMIYWISGNAGCGKSTLMKFLCDDTMTQQVLHSWSQENRLIVASFFFWKPGTAEQNSIKGMLRSLLYQVLLQCSDLVPLVLSALKCKHGPSFQYWDAGSGADSTTRDAWTIDAMWTALETISEQKIVDCKICFLIDGLDELTGDRAMLTLFFVTLAPSQNIRVCASSRPENFFVSLFRKRLHIEVGNILRLHDLNEKDISSFIKGQLLQWPEFKQTFSNALESSRFIRTFVQKAEGVFLWAEIAVNNVLNNLCDGDTIEVIKEKLDRLPNSENLDRFFQGMIDNIKPEYRAQSRDIFSVRVTALDVEQDLPLLALPFMINDDASEGLDATEIQRPDEIASMLDIGQRRLNARCGGLVKTFDKVKEWLDPEQSVKHEVTPYGLIVCRQAGLVHRAVAEFLRRSEFYANRTNSKMSQSISPLGLLATGFVKCLGYLPIGSDIHQAVWRLIEVLMLLLKKLELMESTKTIQLCKLFQQTMIRNCRCSAYSRNGLTLPADEVARLLLSCAAGYDSSKSLLQLMFGSFAAFFVTSGPSCWLEKKLLEKDAEYRPESQMLTYVALYPLALFRVEHDSKLDPTTRNMNTLVYLDYYGTSSLTSSSIQPGVLVLLLHRSMRRWYEFVSPFLKPEGLQSRPTKGIEDGMSIYHERLFQFTRSNSSSYSSYTEEHDTDWRPDAEAIRIPLEQILLFDPSGTRFPVGKLLKLNGVVQNVDEYFVCYVIYVWILSCSVAPIWLTDYRPAFCPFLHAGANPNHVCLPAGVGAQSKSCVLSKQQQPTIWAVVLTLIKQRVCLRSALRGKEPKKTEEWFDVIMYFLRAGADPNVKVNNLKLLTPMLTFDEKGYWSRMMAGKSIFDCPSTEERHHCNGVRDFVSYMAQYADSEGVREQIESFLIKIDDFIKANGGPLP